MRRKTSTVLFLIVLLTVAGAGWLRTQTQPAAPAAGPGPLGLQDILRWKTISGPELSPDGAWFLYRLSPVEGNGEVVIKQVKGTKEYRFPSGEAPRGYFAPRISFSADSKWAAFFAYPTMSEGRSLKKDKKPAAAKAVLVDLATGAGTEFENVRDFAFSGDDPRFVVFHKNGPEGRDADKDKWAGADLIIRDLTASLDEAVGNVAEFAFDKKGDRLALAMDVRGAAGNGVLIRDMRAGTLVPLASDKASFKRLSWTEKGDGLAFLKGREDKDYEDRRWSVVGFKGFGSPGSPEKVEYDPAADAAFPAGMTISPDRTPRWSGSLQTLFFGIRELKKKAVDAKKDEPDEDTPDLVIWHWRDKRLQAQQQVEAGADSTYSYLAMYRPAGKKFVRLADDGLREVIPAEKDMFAVGLDESPYELDAGLTGRSYQDVYVIDLRTGERSRVLEKCRWYFGSSPDGRRFLYYRDGHFYAYDMAGKTSLNLTVGMPVSFIDTEDDHNVTDPPRRPLGWTSDGRQVLLSDGWDIWLVPADGAGKAVDLTAGDGRREQVRYRRRFVLDRDEKGADLTKPVYFGIYGEWTKKAGIAVLDRNKPGVRKLVWEDAAFSSLIKADKAPVFAFTRETVRDFPDYFTAGPDLAAPIRLTEADPQQKDFLWSAGSMLVDYKSAKGDRLQAALFLPAGYRKGRSYPTIVYIYEKLSDGLNSYGVPSPYGFNKSVYTSNGYAVLMPDITYKLNDPGMSAVWCVLPALQAAAATGVVDLKKVGLQGHSWGGYQTAFLVTQTDAFAAAVPGAALTDMVSMYSSIYWNSGSANQPIFESSQGRFLGGYLDNAEAYIRNSPVFFAANVKTPILMLHNDKDGAVDWNQGIEFYNTLRRLHKNVVMLEYPGENHGLARPANRKDYGRRMLEFFDHYLKGAPAPAWYTDGVPYLKIKEHLKERTVALKLTENAGDAARKDKSAAEKEK